mmetsp:Transcript_64773/g.104841  ORF Transcript_64773/g.104841 Transcript_64773/m.104841 type:complete len:217 (+) Transcript_64773:379-1029(+)
MTSIRRITPRASNTFSTALSPGSPKTNASGVNEIHFPPFAVSLATQPGSVLGKLAEFAPFKALRGGLNEGWRESVCVCDDVELVRDEACIMVGDESRGDEYVRGRPCALLGVCGCVRVCVCVYLGDLGRAGGGEGRRFRSCDFVGVFFFSRGGVRRSGATTRFAGSLSLLVGDQPTSIGGSAGKYSGETLRIFLGFLCLRARGFSSRSSALGLCWR